MGQLRVLLMAGLCLVLVSCQGSETYKLIEATTESGNIHDCSGPEDQCPTD